MGGVGSSRRGLCTRARARRLVAPGPWRRARFGGGGGGSWRRSRRRMGRCDAPSKVMRMRMLRRRSETERRRTPRRRWCGVVLCGQRLRRAATWHRRRLVSPRYARRPTAARRCHVARCHAAVSARCNLARCNLAGCMPRRHRQRDREPVPLGTRAVAFRLEPSHRSPQLPFDIHSSEAQNGTRPRHHGTQEDPAAPFVGGANSAMTCQHGTRPPGPGTRSAAQRRA